MEFIQWEFQHPGAFVTLDDERMIISGAIYSWIEVPKILMILEDGIKPFLKYPHRILKSRV